MTASLDAVAGDECVCPCHRDPSIHHVMACCADCEQCSTRVVTPSLRTHRPVRCAGFRSGRLALGADAVVCVLAGLALVVLGLVHSVLPTARPVVLGALIALCGVALWLAPRRWPLRAVLALGTAANLVVVIALGAIAIAVKSNGPSRWIAVVAAAVVATFGAWEWLALRKTQRSDGSVE